MADTDWHVNAEQWRKLLTLVQTARPRLVEQVYDDIIERQLVKAWLLQRTNNAVHLAPWSAVHLAPWPAAD